MSDCNGNTKEQKSGFETLQDWEQLIVQKLKESALQVNLIAIGIEDTCIRNDTVPIDTQQLSEAREHLRLGYSKLIGAVAGVTTLDMSSKLASK